MPRPPKTNKVSLDDQFRFAEDSFRVGGGAWDSQLRFGVGVEDGERYLLRLFKKTGTPLDEDLSRLIARGLRRIRRVLSSRRSRDLLVEVREIVEDRDEFAIVMLDPGSPIAGSSRATRARQSLFLSGTGRKTFWRNITRVAEALAVCHDAGIVHGAISEHAIFSHGDDREDYRLGGYEACVHIGDGDLGGTGHPLRQSGAISFRQDWMDLGRTAATILGVTSDGGPSLLAIERRMVDRLINPPQYQLFDGSVVLRELAELTDELERVGTGSEGEFVLYPSQQVMQSDLPQLTSGSIAAGDTQAVLQFVEEDLLGSDVRAVVTGRDTVKIVTDLATYGVRIVDDRIGMLVKADKRRPVDRIYDAVELKHRLYLSRNRRSSEERVRKLGPGAMRWAELSGQGQSSSAARDVASWYALIVLEAFTWLREQFRLYPVEILPAAPDDEASLVWLLPSEEADGDQRRQRIGLRPAADALKRELRHDDGRTEWTVTRSGSLAGGRERLPDLRYLGSGEYKGRQAFAFTSSQAIVAGERYFVRPRRDTGFERAIRRRLQNIVAARSNVELLRALDDPAQVALDDALREIAAPGDPPADLDETKKLAWASIAAGKSINIVVGPPGVGKTYLISNLVRSILKTTHDARVLISAQNHETLVQMEDELKKNLPAETSIVVRVERSGVDEKTSVLREASVAILRSTSDIQVADAAILASQRRQIKQTLDPVDDAERETADRVFRDTDNLLLRSSDVTLATASSYVIEEMIADGDQFDWVIVEEAARANGAELVGALLLGNRRVMIGDHKQLSPFDVVDRQKFYAPAVATELLRDAKEQISAISDLPPEVETTLELIKSDQTLLPDVLATAARLEEAFRSIAEREGDREKTSGRPSSIANILLEQSRMHPAICELVSNTFYNKSLISSERVKKRPQTVMADAGFPTAPIVVLDLPALSVVKKQSFEQQVKRSYRNATEATALLVALKKLRPTRDKDGRLPTLVVLSPYLAQVDHFERLLKHEIDPDAGTLFGFESPRKNGKFVYTSDSFQGGEADVVIASLVRNNMLVGTRALGFMKNPQRMNVLLSRARQKLVLATSRQFIADAVSGVDPDRRGGELEFLRTMLGEIGRLTQTEFDGVGTGAAVVEVDERGGLRP
ncbi:DEAD/DEAH box helicase [Gluconacetobacter sacchari]|uniref:DEAD/DEAH box helicase n=1 Tax=Gluconacetobacter sacchari TaxID=92759 RepID=UPI0039B5622D